MKLWVAPHGLHVEPAVPDDAGEMARLHAAAFFRGWPVEDFATYLRDPKVTPAYVVCDARRRIAGFMVLRQVAETCDLLTIVIDKRWRGKGVGAALLRAGFEDLRRTPVTHMLLEVEEANPAAVRLYRNFGFSEVSRREGYYQMPDGGKATALVMRCDLN